MADLLAAAAVAGEQLLSLQVYSIERFPSIHCLLFLAAVTKYDYHNHNYVCYDCQQQHTYLNLYLYPSRTRVSHKSLQNQAKKDKEQLSALRMELDALTTAKEIVDASLAEAGD